MRLEKIEKILSNEKKEFKILFWMTLTNKMVSYMTGIPKSTIDNLSNFKDKALENYYFHIKAVDFSSIINKDAIYKYGWPVKL